MFLGTEKYRTCSEMEAMLTSMGCTPHADSNAVTDFTSTVFMLSASSNDEALPLYQRKSAVQHLLRDDYKQQHMSRLGHKANTARISDRIAERYHAHHCVLGMCLNDASVFMYPRYVEKNVGIIQVVDIACLRGRVWILTHACICDRLQL